jgi:hypothetical protein
MKLSDLFCDTDPCFPPVPIDSAPPVRIRFLDVVEASIDEIVTPLVSQAFVRVER